MIDAELFDKIEAVARAVRKNETPFGGIQLPCLHASTRLEPNSS